jgi:hypothetical protein
MKLAMTMVVLNITIKYLPIERECRVPKKIDAG